ncbi:MAG: hypothetical protein J6T57_03270 [Alphaproteobacteria bacterium]|nr:hypothetical protein [Alphaproteobacteria bacterium]
MKKLGLLSLVLAMVAAPAMANYYATRTNNCDPRAMHAVLENAVREHRTVITEVSCDSVAVVSEPVYVAPAPVYEPVYAPMPVYAPSVDYSYIPVVDCVPGPTSCEYCGGMR